MLAPLVLRPVSRPLSRAKSSPEGRAADRTGGSAREAPGAAFWAPSSSLGGHRRTGQVIGSATDPLEAEADRVAARVLRAPGPSQAYEPGDSRQPSASETLSSPGRPLPEADRAFFEPRFGHDFSRVRIHADAHATESAHALGALAYTAGPHITFAAGRYQPANPEGRRLLAHELVHVVQQGHAGPVPGHRPVGIAANRATPAIQRDVPKGGPAAQTAPASETAPRPEVMDTPPKSSATKAEVTRALTDTLFRIQGAQGGQTLHITNEVRWAIRPLFQGDPMGSVQAEAILNQAAPPGSAPALAEAITKLLPSAIPRSRMAHLPTQAAADAPDKRPKTVGQAAGNLVVDSTVAPMVKGLPIADSWKKAIVDGARSAVGDGLVSTFDQAIASAPITGAARSALHSAVEGAIKKDAATPMNRQQDGAGSPFAQPAPPPRSSSLPPINVPGEHIFPLPAFKWDVPSPTPAKPNLPQAPAAADAAAVDKIIQGLDNKAFVPAAAKGKPEEANFTGAQDLARSVANLIAAADKKKQYTVEFTISQDYRHVGDLATIFDNMEKLIRQIAAALPGGAANVGQVIISPPKNNPQDLPARRIVRLHESQ